MPREQNLPGSHVVAPANPNVEGTNSGMNAASCFPVVGITSGLSGLKETDWSNEQRLAMKTQPIGWGGDSIVTGQQTGDLPAVLAVEYDDADFNDNFGFVLTTVSTVADAQIGVTGYFNKTGETIASGVWLWGVKPNA